MPRSYHVTMFDILRWYGCRGNEDIPSRRLIVKFYKIETLFKNTGTANPLINSGDAVLVFYSISIMTKLSETQYLFVGLLDGKNGYIDFEYY